MRIVIVVVTHNAVTGACVEVGHPLHAIERLLLQAEEQRNFMRVKEAVILARRQLLDFMEDLQHRAA